MANKQKINNKSYTLSLDANLIEALDELSESQKRTRSSEVEVAIEKHLSDAGYNKEGDKWVR